MADVGNKRFCLFLLLAVQLLPKSAAVLPARAGLIEQYFNLGLNYSEILLFLGLSHGCFLSIRQLKRILKHLGLGRRNRSNPQIICEAIEEELHGSGSMLGYRQMARRLLHEYGVSTDKETVRQLLKIMDPQGVESRSKITKKTIQNSRSKSFVAYRRLRQTQAIWILHSWSYRRL